MWKLKNELQITEWYKEVWNIASNDKPTRDIKFKKEFDGQKYFAECQYVFICFYSF